MLDDKERRRGYTRKCRAKMTVEHKQYLNSYYLRSWKAYIGRRTYSAICEDRNHNFESNITTKYITELLQAQDFRCALSGVDLIYGQSLLSMSIDRIDNNIRHIVGNIQLVCLGINLAKNDATNNDIKYVIECIRGNSEFIPSEPFSRDYLSSCRRNTEERDIERTGPTGNGLTTDVLLELYHKQNGKCALTGITMAGYEHPCLSVSVDRIDNNKIHTLDNIRLTLKCMNRAKKDYSDTNFNDWLNKIRSNK